MDPVVSFETAYGLADSGAQQVAELADHFRRDYSNLFDFPFNEENYVVRNITLHNLIIIQLEYSFIEANFFDFKVCFRA